ncbi:MAG: transcriptional repressor [Candidatus Thiodiazotropha lotti]|uniref:Ferric uptake regulation protein n=1 Tax=Candidatus Thiodiazotropha endoloripes TaxID=1818881 RepID=A0A1E2UUL4_9GAMM|nr:Fur family transcriptional regulator [Candidatus Thiodiazotropha endoloripes]MCG7899877.1 transcriptional repressor [Candidatus Thiodiazotropha weberae]MCG7990988.1 transcriptional repressor [Candidatus Thiodiazotropha lotti]MCG7903022.1 transcriptional repressor [Candidatus Thiodiazotropha weberae]MCG7914566.1 transcriptional repressor [Candidatus Thiodiazotropha weberae]MCG8001029.1 transcriptional repressor [Candidatus Thiodiazotropha lotti]
MKPNNPAFPSADHDHNSCVSNALKNAEAYCLQQGLRLTKLRHQVLELIWANHQPVGAYELLEQLTQKGRKAAPPTVYRALDFLMENGLVHRISSRNAYVGCSHTGHDHTAQFLICETCGQVAELDDARIGSVIAKDADQLGFTVAQWTLEISGICDQCNQGTADE